MTSPHLPQWERRLVDDAIDEAERRLEEERKRSRKRAIQLAREQAYHRLAAAIDRPMTKKPGPGQLKLFPLDATLFDDTQS